MVEVSWPLKLTQELLPRDSECLLTTMATSASERAIREPVWMSPVTLGSADQLSVQGALKVEGVAQIGGDLSVTGSLTIAGDNLGPTNADRLRAVQITADGTMRSPMWAATQVYLNEQATAVPFPVPGQTICPPKPFTTGGGTLLILASGSGAALSGVPGPIVIGMDLLVDDRHAGNVLCRVNNMTEAKPFITSGLVVRGIAAGSHTLTLKTSKSTVVGVNDFFNVTILELPFE